MSAADALRAIEGFFEGFNARDDRQIRESLNFPHIRLASSTVRVIERPEDFHTPFEALRKAEGWNHSTLDSAEVIHTGAGKVHFAVRFSRYRDDGECYVTHEAVWIVTQLEGHWGVQARSSFAP